MNIVEDQFLREWNSPNTVVSVKKIYEVISPRDVQAKYDARYVRFYHEKIAWQNELLGKSLDKAAKRSAHSTVRSAYAT